MRRLGRLRTCVLGTLAAAIAASLAVVAVGLAAQSTDAPDLTGYFPPGNGLTVNAFVDTYTAPGKVLYRFDSVNDVVERANCSRYGLNASVWTRDARRGRAIASRIQAGSVNVNDAYAPAWASVDAPMGGFKESGLGRRHGTEGILKYTESQTIAIQHGLPLAIPRGISGERMSQLSGR